MQTKKLSSAKTPVVVETKKISDSCCASDSCGSACSCSKVSHIVMMVLLLVNTAFLVLSFSMIRNNESIKVGGRENYKMAKEIYKTEGFKAYQKQQIQQALQMFKGGTNSQESTAVAPTDGMGVPSLETEGAKINTVELPKK